MESIHYVWWKQHAVIEFLGAKKESVRNFHKYLCDVYGSAKVEKSTVSCWAKRVMASGTGKAYPMICLAQAILSQQFVVKCRNMLMPSFARISASQPDSWHSVFQSWKRLLVTSLRISDFWRCAWNGFPGALQSHTKPREEPFILSCWHILKLRESLTFLGLWQQTKPMFIILNRQEKLIHGLAPCSICPEEKIHVVSFRGQGDDHCLLGLWRCDSFGCIAEMGEGQLWHLRQGTDRTWEAFQMNLPSQESNRYLASARHCKATHKFEDYGCHHKICLDIIACSTMQSTEWSLLLEQDKAWYQYSVHARFTLHTRLYLIGARL